LIFAPGGALDGAAREAPCPAATAEASLLPRLTSHSELLMTALALATLLLVRSAAAEETAWPSAADVAACADSAFPGQRCVVKSAQGEKLGSCRPTGRGSACATTRQELLQAQLSRDATPQRVVVLAPRTLAKVSEYEIDGLPQALSPISGGELLQGWSFDRKLRKRLARGYYRIDPKNVLQPIAAKDVPAGAHSDAVDAEIRTVVVDARLPTTSCQREGDRLVIERAGAAPVVVAPPDSEFGAGGGQVHIFNHGRSLLVAETSLTVSCRGNAKPRFSLVRDVNDPKLESCWEGAQPIFQGMAGSRDSDKVFVAVREDGKEKVYAWRPLSTSAPKMIGVLASRLGLLKPLEASGKLVWIDKIDHERKPTDTRNHWSNHLVVVDGATDKIERTLVLAEDESIELGGSMTVKGHPLVLLWKQVVDVREGKVIGVVPDLAGISKLVLDPVQGLIYYSAHPPDLRSAAITAFDPIANKRLGEFAVPKDPSSFIPGAKHLLLGRDGHVLVVFGEEALVVED
jgi:hypothetical protein